MQIRKSAEDYLEAILVLSKQGGGVRSTGTTPAGYSGFPTWH